MSFGAFARTRILREKAGVHSSMKNWWKKMVPVEGEVRRMIGICRGCFVPRWYSSLAAMSISICIEHKKILHILLDQN
jgi:hypothetical protein